MSKFTDLGEIEYEVKEKRARHGGAGATELYLLPTDVVKLDDDRAPLNKEIKDMDEDEFPDGIEIGDVISSDDILAGSDRNHVGDGGDDPDADEQALEEAAETGERVTISTTTADCIDADKECSLDHVSRIATPDGEIVEERTHTY